MLMTALVVWAIFLMIAIGIGYIKLGPPWGIKDWKFVGILYFTCAIVYIIVWAIVLLTGNNI